jgi:hypothetical protein
MSLAPSRTAKTVLSGQFSFRRTYQGTNEISEVYEIRVQVDVGFPKVPPIIEEIGRKIKRTAEYHVNPDGSLCLGSPIRLRAILANEPTLCAFVEKCLVPYLYAMTYKMRHGGKLIFGELAHGDSGEIEDYETLFQVRGKGAVLNALKALSLKKRIANKRQCPCNCGQRLGKCRTHKVLNPFRKIYPRCSYAAIYRRLNS